MKTAEPHSHFNALVARYFRHNAGISAALDFARRACVPTSRKVDGTVRGRQEPFRRVFRFLFFNRAV